MRCRPRENTRLTRRHASWEDHHAVIAHPRLRAQRPAAYALFLDLVTHAAPYTPGAMRPPERSTSQLPHRADRAELILADGERLTVHPLDPATITLADHPIETDDWIPYHPMAYIPAHEMTPEQAAAVRFCVHRMFPSRSR